jgi:hypothetical protein
MFALQSTGSEKKELGVKITFLARNISSVYETSFSQKQ